LSTQQKPPPEAPAPADEDGIWVSTQLTASGGYACSVERGERHLATLDRFAALRYADAFTRHIAYARYDAAVYRQLKTAGVNDKAALGMMIHNLRTARPPVSPADTYPIVVQTIVSQRDGRPRLTLSDGTGTPWQWDTTDAEKHVLHVLQISATVDADAIYYQQLREVITLDEPVARHMIGDLRNHNPDHGD
jgi:hypothetical protein